MLELRQAREQNGFRDSRGYDPGFVLRALWKSIQLGQNVTVTRVLFFHFLVREGDRARGVGVSRGKPVTGGAAVGFEQRAARLQGGEEPVRHVQVVQAVHGRVTGNPAVSHVIAARERLRRGGELYELVAGDRFGEE